VIIPGSTACACCGGAWLSKLGEDITETLEVIPKSWKVIQHVREKFSCRDCEKINQAPAPFHVIARGWAGPSLLAMVLFEKFGQHQPLNRQAERYARRSGQSVDPGRPGRWLHGGADALVQAPRGQCRALSALLCQGPRQFRQFTAALWQPAIVSYQAATLRGRRTRLREAGAPVIERMRDGYLGAYLRRQFR
jgi:hypothetical protein